MKQDKETAKPEQYVPNEARIYRQEAARQLQMTRSAFDDFRRAILSNFPSTNAIEREHIARWLIERVEIDSVGICRGCGRLFETTRKRTTYHSAYCRAQFISKQAKQKGYKRRRLTQEQSQELIRSAQQARIL